MAKDPDGDDYCRVKVTSIKENIADCFYVDYGDQQFVDVLQLIHLSDRLITQLPFQVIECRLYGVKPILDCWSPEAVDILYEYCFEPQTDYFRTLYTKICNTETSRLTQGTKYALLLIDTMNSKPVMVNSVIIDCGFAVAVDSEHLDKEISINVNNSQEEEDGSEEEDVVDEQNYEVAEKQEGDDDDKDFGVDKTLWDVQIFDIKKFFTQEDINVSTIDIFYPLIFL